MSRLDYAPKLKEIEITDIKKGLGSFAPKPDRPVSFAALHGALKKAGYKLDAAEITLAGVLARDRSGDGWIITVEPSGQTFTLTGADVEQLLAGAAPGARLELTGDWKSAGAGALSREQITPRRIEKTTITAVGGPRAAGIAAPLTFRGGVRPAVRFLRAGGSYSLGGRLSPAPPAPIRTTTPGLTVYRGGAITPRLYLLTQSLGDLDVTRQVLDLSASYTPTPRLQLEIEVPYTRASFAGEASGLAGSGGGSGGRPGETASTSRTGWGNVTLWGKYRFYRKVQTYGDRQAAARFGLELPTGSRRAPNASEVNAPAFVRQQLTPINGGWSPHFDVAISQARERFIYGANIEAIVRAPRDGYRLGHEVRVNTDMEYVLFPRDYRKPGKELFTILETTFVRRGSGRLDNARVAGSTATEFYLSPGLQYAADPRFVIEGSLQIPVARRTGPLALRAGANLLLGVKYLF